MRPRLRSLASITATALLVGACTGGTPSVSPPASTSASVPASSPSTNPSSSAEPVKLTYFTFSAAPDHLKDLDAIAQAFHAKNPNVTIEVQTAAYDQYFTKLQT